MIFFSFFVNNFCVINEIENIVLPQFNYDLSLLISFSKYSSFPLALRCVPDAYEKQRLFRYFVVAEQRRNGKGSTKRKIHI